jgi:hypothetical protein
VEALLLPVHHRFAGVAQILQALAGFYAFAAGVDEQHKISTPGGLQLFNNIGHSDCCAPDIERCGLDGEQIIFWRGRVVIAMTRKVQDQEIVFPNAMVGAEPATSPR